MPGPAPLPDETPTPAYLTECGSFRYFGHPHMQGLGVWVYGIGVTGKARLVVRQSDGRRVGEHVARECYYLPLSPDEER